MEKHNQHYPIDRQQNTTISHSPTDQNTTYKLNTITVTTTKKKKKKNKINNSKLDIEKKIHEIKRKEERKVQSKLNESSMEINH